MFVDFPLARFLLICFCASLTKTANKGGRMYKRVFRACCLSVVLSIVTLHAQSPPRLSLRAASVEPVEGWQTLQVEHCQGDRCSVWVSSISALTENDIESAQPEVRADGYRRVRVVFTDAGVNKMHELTVAQLRKYMALVVDGKVLWAPMVQSIYNERATPKDTL